MVERVVQIRTVPAVLAERAFQKEVRHGQGAFVGLLVKDGLLLVGRSARTDPIGRQANGARGSRHQTGQKDGKPLAAAESCRCGVAAAAAVDRVGKKGPRKLFRGRRGRLGGWQRQKGPQSGVCGQRSLRIARLQDQKGRLGIVLRQVLAAKGQVVLGKVLVELNVPLVNLAAAGAQQADRDVAHGGTQNDVQGALLQGGIVVGQVGLQELDGGGADLGGGEDAELGVAGRRWRLGLGDGGKMTAAQQGEEKGNHSQTTRKECAHHRRRLHVVLAGWISWS